MAATEEMNTERPIGTTRQNQENTNEVLSDDNLCQLWMSQSNLMWSTVYASPSIAGGFFVAWYSVLFSCNWVLPFLISMFGFICMVFQTAIVWRMSEYNGALFLNIKDKIPHRPAVWKISGKHLAKSVSLTLCCVFIALIGYSFEFSDNCKSSQNVFSNFLTQLFAN